MIEDIINFLNQLGKSYKLRVKGNTNEIHFRNPPNTELYYKLRQLGLKPHPKNKHCFMEAS